MFKIQGFDKAGSGLLLKGAHEGPALTSAQLAAINNWVCRRGRSARRWRRRRRRWRRWRRRRRWTGTGGGRRARYGGGDGGGAGTGGGKTACQTGLRGEVPGRGDEVDRLQHVRDRNLRLVLPLILRILSM